MGGSSRLTSPALSDPGCAAGPRDGSQGAHGGAGSGGGAGGDTLFRTVGSTTCLLVFTPLGPFSAGGMDDLCDCGRARHDDQTCHENPTELAFQTPGFWNLNFE